MPTPENLPGQPRGRPWGQGKDLTVRSMGGDQLPCSRRVPSAGVGWGVNRDSQGHLNPVTPHSG